MKTRRDDRGVGVWGVVVWALVCMAGCGDGADDAMPVASGVCAEAPTSDACRALTGYQGLWSGWWASDMRDGDGAIMPLAVGAETTLRLECVHDPCAAPQVTSEPSGVVRAEFASGAVVVRGLAPGEAALTLTYGLPFGGVERLIVDVEVAHPDALTLSPRYVFEGEQDRLAVLTSSAVPLVLRGWDARGRELGGQRIAALEVESQHGHAWMEHEAGRLHTLHSGERADTIRARDVHDRVILEADVVGEDAVASVYGVVYRALDGDLLSEDREAEVVFAEAEVFEPGETVEFSGYAWVRVVAETQEGARVRGAGASRLEAQQGDGAPNGLVMLPLVERAVAVYAAETFRAPGEVVVGWSQPLRFVASPPAE